MLPLKHALPAIRRKVAQKSDTRRDLQAVTPAAAAPPPPPPPRKSLPRRPGKQQQQRRRLARGLVGRWIRCTPSCCRSLYSPYSNFLFLCLPTAASPQFPYFFSGRLSDCQCSGAGAHHEEGKEIAQAFLAQSDGKGYVQRWASLVLICS